MDQELANLYSSAVKPRGGVHMGSGGGSGFGAVYERDPNLIKLESSVFSKLAEIAEPTPTFKPEYKTNGLKVVSVEEAIRELREIESSTQGSPPAS